MEESQVKIDPRKKDHLGLYNKPFSRQVEGIRLQRIADAINVQKGETVAEIGCGHGHIMQKILGREAHYIGVDVNLASLGIAREVLGNRSNLSLVAADALSLPLASATVDKLICSEVLEHLPGLDVVLTEFVRVMRKGGIGVITTPNDPLMKIARLIMWPFLEYKALTPPTHIHSFDRGKLRDLLAGYFEVKKVDVLYGIRLFAVIEKC